MRKLLLLIPLFFVVGQAFAQRISVTGNVVDKSTQNPAVGILVTVEETKATTVTDAAGAFRIDANVGQTLRITSLGYTPASIKVANANRLRVELEADVTSLDEVVVTGYGTQRKADLTGAVAVVNVAQSKDVPNANVMQSLQGKIAGVNITTSGNPNGGTTVNIRGSSTIQNNNFPVGPLYVIDGVPTTDGNILAGIDQNSIESFQVLKDAASASIYGSRAAGGVIIVTTKTGKDAVNIQFTSSVTTQKNDRLVPMMNTQQYGEALWGASVNDRVNPTQHAALYTYNWNGNFDNPVLNSVTPTATIGGDPTLVAGDTNWQDQVFRRGLISSNSLTATAGSQRSNVLFNLTYYTNDGLVINNGFKRISGRVNTSTNFFNNKLKIGENFQFNKTRQTPIPSDLGGTNVIALANIVLPILPVYKSDGTFSGPLGAGFSDRSNPVHISQINRDDRDNDLYAFGNMFAELSIIPNLTLRSTLGLDYNNNMFNNIERAFQTGSLGRTLNSLTVRERHNLTWNFQNQATYSLIRPKSRTTFLAAMEANKNIFKELQAGRQGFAIENTEYYVLDAGTGTVSNSGRETGSQLLSYFGRINYALSDKYLASLILRRDGSSRFGQNNQYGFFPGASLGWVLSKESFFSKALPSVSELKLRAGWAQTGQQASIPNDARFQVFQTNYNYGTSNTISGSAYDINGAGSGSLASGYVPTQAGNPDLKWETTTELNLGLDFGIFRQKVTGSFDYFTRRTKDILRQITPAAIVGQGSAKYVNSATVDNKGYEIGLAYADRKGDISWRINTNVSHQKDKVVAVPASQLASFGGNAEKNIIGRSQTDVFGYYVDGIFQNATEVAAAAARPGKGVGRLKYRDLNGDKVINVLDQDWLGNSLPNLSYNIDAQIGYKNFGLVISGRGLQGVNVSDASRSLSDFMGTTAGVNKGTRLLQAWNINNTSSTIPAMSLNNNNNETQQSNYNRVRGDYFKIQTAQLNYTLPGPIIQKFKMQNFRLFVIAENFLLLKNQEFTGPDPETPGNIYPRPTNFTIGFDAKF